MDERLKNEIAHGRRIASYAKGAWDRSGTIGSLQNIPCKTAFAGFSFIRQLRRDGFSA